jgi:hypothetical protein
MINFKLNDKTFAIPQKWEEVTFDQYLKIFELKDDTIQLVSIFTGLYYDYLKNAVIIGLDDILTALSFIYKMPEFPGSVSECGPFQIPNNSKGAFNIQHESLGQFEDMRAVMNKLPEDIKAHTAAYAEYVAIYLQKIRDGEYSHLKAQMMVEEIYSYPAYQVITLGSFFFLKLKSFSNGSQRISPSTTRSPKKSKPATTNSKKRSARSPRSQKRR